MAKKKGMTIIVTWLVDDVEFIGPEARVDLGERRRTRAIKRGEAVLWKASGSETDVKKAWDFAKSQGPDYDVFTYPASSSDSAVAKWKAKARTDALLGTKKNVTADDILRGAGVK